MSSLLEQIERANEINRRYVKKKFDEDRIRSEEKARSDQIKKGFHLENNTTVSMIEKLNGSEATLTKLYNFGVSEVTTLFGTKGMCVQQFDEIADQNRIEKAAKALKEFGGDPGAWQSRNSIPPGTVKPKKDQP